MDGDDLDLFERSVRNATDKHTGQALDTALVELGWVDALAVDPRAAISILFELQGRANVISSALDLVVSNALGLPLGAATAVVLPDIGAWLPPGTIDGTELRLQGLATSALHGARVVTIVAATGGESGEAGNAVDHAVTVFEVPATKLELRPVEGIDPGLGLLRVTGFLDTTDTALTNTDSIDPVSIRGSWDAAVAVARLAIGHELVGVSRTMLELAREHALERVQFGRPIASFQAVRHRLAEALVAIETAEAVLDAAWLDGSHDTAAMAKAVAGRGARTVARHCQQVLAGIGFTTEHSLHLYIRRSLVLDGLFGTATTLTRAFGAEMVATRELPPLLPL